MKSHGATILGLAVVVAAALLSGRPARADLPAKVDPSKRARITTTGAIQPAAQAMPSAFTGARIIRLDRVTVRTSSRQDQRATIEVGETRGKSVIRPDVRTPAVRTAEGRRVGDLPASVPRLDVRVFRNMLSDYEAGRTPAGLALDRMIEVNGREVDIGAINRFANPRRTLEAQGIPVIRAGSEEPAAPEPATSPAPAPAPQ